MCAHENVLSKGNALSVFDARSRSRNVEKLLSSSPSAARFGIAVTIYSTCSFLLNEMVFCYQQ